MYTLRPGAQLAGVTPAFGSFGNAENSRAEARGCSAVSAMPKEVGPRHGAGGAGCGAVVARLRGFRQFSAVRQFRQPKSVRLPLLYIGIYTYYLLSIYKIDDRKRRKSVLSLWKGSRFPFGSPADILPIARAENTGKSAPSVKKCVAMAIARAIVRTPSQLFSETPK